MADEAVESGTGAVEREPLVDPIPPAPAADDQKSDTPAATDENAKPEEKSDPEETPEQAEAKKQSRRQRQLTREKVARASAETEARLLRERVAELEAKGKPQEPAEPKRSDINPETGEVFDYETHLRRLAKWDAKQEASAIVKAEREANEGKQQTERSRQEQAQNRDWTDKETAFKATAADYEDVAKDFLETDESKALSDAARKVIVESGPAMLYYLGKNEEFASDLADMSPRDQKAELVKLGATLKAAPQKKTSSAPPPLKTINGGRSANHGITGNETQAEYEAKRKQMGAKWAR